MPVLIIYKFKRDCVNPANDIAIIRTKYAFSTLRKQADLAYNCTHPIFSCTRAFKSEDDQIKALGPSQHFNRYKRGTFLSLKGE